MKKSVLNKIIVCLTALIMMFGLLALTGCGSGKDDDAPDVETFDISVSIDFPVKSELLDQTDETFKIEEGSTVLEVTEVYCSVNNIPLTVETTKGMVYGIEDVYNGDFYKNRQWRYKVNGKLCADPPGEKYLRAGDKLEWYFVK